MNTTERLKNRQYGYKIKLLVVLQKTRCYQTVSETETMVLTDTTPADWLAQKII